MKTCRLDNLKTQRIAAGLTIQALARKALVNDGTINRLEQLPRGGECTLPEADRIAAALGVSLATLGQALL